MSQSTLHYDCDVKDGYFDQQQALRKEEFSRSPLSDDDSPTHGRQYSFIGRDKAGGSFISVNRDTQIDVVDKDKLNENL